MVSSELLPRRVTGIPAHTEVKVLDTLNRDEQSSSDCFEMSHSAVTRNLSS